MIGDFEEFEVNWFRVKESFTGQTTPHGNFKLFSFEPKQLISEITLNFSGITSAVINKLITATIVEEVKETPTEEDVKNLITVEKLKKFILINNTTKLFLVSNYLENVKEFHKFQPFFYDRNNIFWFWEDYKWTIRDETDLLNKIEEMMKFNGQTVTSNYKSCYLESFKRVGRQNIPKLPSKKWVQFKNQIYDLETKKIFEATPDYFICNPIPWKIGSKEETPVIELLFEQWVGKDFVKTLYEIIAYCCIADYPLHVFIILFGSGRNGKSVFQRLLSKFIGAENIASTELDTLLQSRFETARLHKKLVCLIGETNLGILKKTSMLKKLTGQDLIGYEYKNKKPFEDYNYAKIIINSNALPVSEDESDGFYRRTMIIKFPNEFSEEKDILEIIPDQEFENLAKRVLSVLPELIKAGSFSNRGNIEARKVDYVLASNPLEHFMERFCEHEADNYVSYSVLYSAYIQYLGLKKLRIVSKNEFSKVLSIAGFTLNRTSRRISEGNYIKDTFVDGTKLKDNWKLMIFSDTPITGLGHDTQITQPFTVPLRVEKLRGVSSVTCVTCVRPLEAVKTTSSNLVEIPSEMKVSNSSSIENNLDPEHLISLITNEEEILNFIKLEDGGGGVGVPFILANCSSEEEGIRWITQAKERGDIFSPSPDRWKVLE